MYCIIFYIEACDVTETLSLNIITEETITVASSKESPNVGLCELNT